NQVGAALEDVVRKRSAPALVIVAPPRVLADLRRTFHPDVKARIVAEIDKDLTKHPVGEVRGAHPPALEGWRGRRNRFTIARMRDGGLPPGLRATRVRTLWSLRSRAAAFRSPSPSRPCCARHSTWFWRARSESRANPNWRWARSLTAEARSSCATKT